MVRRGNVLMPLDRNPHETFLLAWAAFLGVGRIVAEVRGVAPPPSIDGAWWIDAAWYVLLAYGGVAGLVGTWWRDPITGVLIVRAAMIPLAAGALLYASALSANANHRTAVIITAFGAASAWRAVQITRDIRAVPPAA